MSAFCGLLEGLPVEDAICRTHRFAGRKLTVRGATDLYEHLRDSAEPA